MDPTRSFLAIATLGLITALLGSNVVAYVRIVRAAELVVRGEARSVSRSLRSELRELPATPSPGDLAELLESDALPGLVYVALTPASGGPAVRAGAPLLPAPAPPEARGTTTQVRDERARVLISYMPDRKPRSSRSRRRNPYAAIEFELRSELAGELAASGAQSVWIGALSAAMFLGCAAYLARLLRERAEAQARAAHRERLASLGEMSTVLAHEIRTPLTSLKGSGQLLSEASPEDGPIRKKADRIVRQVERLEALVTDLLDFARAGGVERRAVDPTQAIREVCDELKATPQVAFVTDQAPAQWSLDPERIRRVWRNLLQNAQQVAPEGEPVEVTITQARAQLVVTVADRGPGFEPGDLERIFEPFMTRKANGTGLGLAVSQRLVELHGGTLTAENRGGGGALFTVSIPAGEDGPR